MIFDSAIGIAESYLRKQGVTGDLEDFFKENMDQLTSLPRLDHLKTIILNRTETGLLSFSELSPTISDFENKRDWNSKILFYSADNGGGGDYTLTSRVYKNRNRELLEKKVISTKLFSQSFEENDSSPDFNLFYLPTYLLFQTTSLFLTDKWKEGNQYQQVCQLADKLSLSNSDKYLFPNSQAIRTLEEYVEEDFLHLIQFLRIENMVSEYDSFIEGLDKKDTVYLTVAYQTNDDLIFQGEIPLFRELTFKNVLQKFTPESTCGTGQCSCCLNEGTVYGGTITRLESPFSFYTASLPIHYIFASNDKEGRKSFPICRECMLKLEYSKKYINKKPFRYSFNSNLFFILPYSDSKEAIDTYIDLLNQTESLEERLSTGGYTTLLNGSLQEGIVKLFGLPIGFNKETIEGNINLCTFMLKDNGGQNNVAKVIYNKEDVHLFSLYDYLKDIEMLKERLSINHSFYNQYLIQNIIREIFRFRFQLSSESRGGFDSKFNTDYKVNKIIETQTSVQFREKLQTQSILRKMLEYQRYHYRNMNENKVPYLDKKLDDIFKQLWFTFLLLEKRCNRKEELSMLKEEYVFSMEDKDFQDVLNELLSDLQLLDTADRAVFLLGMSIRYIHNKQKSNNIKKTINQSLFSPIRNQRELMKIYNQANEFAISKGYNSARISMTLGECSRFLSEMNVTKFDQTKTNFLLLKGYHLAQLLYSEYEEQVKEEEKEMME